MVRKVVNDFNPIVLTALLFKEYNRHPAGHFFLLQDVVNLECPF